MGAEVTDANPLALFAQQNPETMSVVATFLVGATDGLVKDLVGLGGGDQVKIWRLERAARSLHSAKERLRKDGIDPKPVAPAIGLPLIEASSLEDREVMLDMWVKLLAAAMDPRRANDVRQSYISAIKSMDPTDAMLFSILSANGQKNVRELLANRLQKSSTEIDVSRENLVALRCCFVRPTEAYTDGNFSHMHLTSFGLELRRVLGVPAC